MNSCTGRLWPSWKILIYDLRIQRVLKAPVNWYFRASLIILSFSNVTPLAHVGAGAKNGYLFRVG